MREKDRRKAAIDAAFCLDVVADKNGKSDKKDYRYHVIDVNVQILHKPNSFKSNLSSIALLTAWRRLRAFFALLSFFLSRDLMCMLVHPDQNPCT
jgi:hypothetical protein